MPWNGQKSIRGRDDFLFFYTQRKCNKKEVIMMFFIFDRKGAFTYMLRPYFIQQSETNCCVLYVQDSLGHFCTLTFPSHALLAEAMQRFRDTEKVSVQCAISFDDPYADRERDMVMEQEKEYEEDYQLTLE